MATDLRLAMPQSVDTRPSLAANSALPFAAGVHVGVRPVERVAVFTMGLISIPAEDFIVSSVVTSKRNRVHVRRIHARSIAAGVMYQQARCYRFHQVFVGPPMGSNHRRPSTGIEACISPVVYMRSPHPASGYWIHAELCLKSFPGCHVCSMRSAYDMGAS